jgi:hypothetical protein
LIWKGVPERLLEDLSNPPTCSVAWHSRERCQAWEHGVGITKMPYIHLELGDMGLEVMKRIKKAFDPNNILNPGKVFPEGKEFKAHWSH